ncbi:hypothetical protein HMPREF0762_00846 [Slackia exigua ATCC 700122]|uniref:Uncharacterized protein n=1 Tax=Slackia exigua (strain ATCC 700122 / DSM 15923 / CIP 105133 / JCM 11022 / KCTC 5966 / S-7) TaxID=649764 RepID=D0WG95_SLAES|nr:hypothetical protein HMPREF0762_00846 [Slackia exigua ATCC 700122]
MRDAGETRYPCRASRKRADPLAFGIQCPSMRRDSSILSRHVDSLAFGI